MRRPRFSFTPTTAFLRRLAFYGGLLLLLLIIQTSFAFFEAFHFAVPAIVLAAVSAIGFFDSERSGAVTGIVAGWALDALGGSDIIIMPVVGLMIGYLSGVAAERWLPRGILPWFVCLVAADGASLIATILNIIINVPDIRFGALILHTLIPEFFFTLIFGIPAGLLARLFVRIVRRGATRTNN